MISKVLRCGLVFLLITGACGCTPQVALAGLMALGIIDSMSSSKPGRSAPAPTRPTRSTPQYPSSAPRARPAIVTEGPRRWHSHYKDGLTAYRRFDYTACSRSLGHVISDSTAPAPVRAQAFIYRGAALFLTGDSDGAKRAFRAANRLGARIDETLFRTDIVKLYRSCATVEA